MTFVESVRTCMSKYAQFEGRATRSEYWWFFLAIVIASIVASAISYGVYAVVVLATVIPSLAAGARRLHDTNRSGWWQALCLIPFGVLVVLFFLAQEGKPEAA
jgi:uncharacterized membrane protein YhaH (DUF805 family)